jgi:hypothetical protein
MTYTQLAYLHLATVLPAFAIGAFQLIRRKRTPSHKLLGKIYMVLMLVTALLRLPCPPWRYQGTLWGHDRLVCWRNLDFRHVCIHTRSYAAWMVIWIEIEAQPGKQGVKRKEVKDGYSGRDISWTLHTFAKAIDKRTKGEQSCGKSLSTTSSHWMGIIQV